MRRFHARNSRPRVLVFVDAYNAEKTIESLVRRIPASLASSYAIHVLIIDDASSDSTFRKSYGLSRAEGLPFPICVIINPVYQGCGGNQKLAYRYAVDNDFDFVALLCGDGKYAPESLEALMAPLHRGQADAVFGSPMPACKGRAARRAPRLRAVRNNILCWIENRLLHANLREFQSGFRAYSVAALRAVPFERNSNDFLFDAEIIIQLLIARRPIAAVHVHGCCGDETRHVSGLRYAAGVLTAALKARLQEMSLFYDRRFDCAPAETYSPYTPKFDYQSPHTIALDKVPVGSRVLDLGCAGGYLGSRMRASRHCFVSGMDSRPLSHGVLDEFSVCDLNAGMPHIDASRYDVVLMLDVIEHLNQPEIFLEGLRRKMALNPAAELLISTANVACFVTRAMLLAGQFNYGPRGILDITHTRLFTFASLRRALVQAGFDVIETHGVPAPYPLAIGDNFVSRSLLALNRLLIGVSRGLFSYQIFMRLKARPSLDGLLASAVRHSGMKALVIENESLAQAEITTYH